jgi:hypothetical protein
LRTLVRRSLVNAGAESLARVPESQATIAAKLQPSPTRQLVGLWRKAKTLPSLPHRAQLETLYGIPRASWDPMPIATSAPSESIVVAPRGESALAELRSEVTRYERLLSALEGSEATTGRTYVTALAGKVTALAKLARLETATATIQARVERDVLGRLRPVLERHPDVAAEIAAALEGSS